MEPFDSYPKGGKELLGRFGRGYTIRGNTRKIRGPHFMRKTRQTACAYCGLSFVGSFEKWLQMQLDHVVPRKVCQDLGMFVEWKDDLTNIVLACTACNGFDNQYLPTSEWTEGYTKSVKSCTASNGNPDPKCPKCLETFYILRDQIFQDRKERIRKLREAETEFFKRRPWEEIR